MLNGLGEPIDEKGSLDTKEFYPLQNDPPHPLKRKPVKDVLSVGVRAIDGVLTIGQGQRIGIFPGLVLARVPCWG